MMKGSRLAPSAQENLVLRRMANHRLFRGMLAHQGIDPGRGWKGCEQMIFRALRMCSDCPAPESCHSWLHEKHPRGTYPRLCLNGAVIEGCRIILDAGVPSPRLAEPHPSASDEPPLDGVLADPIIQRLAASDRVRPLTQTPRQGTGILADLDELAGWYL
jgi:hypothetical protein